MTGSTDRLFMSVPRGRRSPLGATLSALLHAAAAVAGLWVADVGAFEPPRPRTASITYLVAPSALPEVALLRERHVPAVSERVDAHRLVRATPEPTPEPVSEVDHVRNLRAAEPEVAPLPAAAIPPPNADAAGPPPPVAPAVSVGAFDAGRPATQSRGRAAGLAHVGQLQAARQPTASAAPESAAVRSAEFDQKSAPRAAVAAAVPDPLDVAVEVIFKPTPDYTEEARALRIEGEVIVEVEFGASEAVRVLRVVRGLGHGLDESAARAAARIRFKPARRAGRPVDIRTIVHIVFRLA